jgi:hypothetical protein
MLPTKKIESIESYFQTNNEHWNDYTFRLLCDSLKQNLFDNPELPLSVFSDSTEQLIREHEHPLKAVKQFNELLDNRKLTPAQKVFIHYWVNSYFSNTEFDNVDMSAVNKLLKNQSEKLKVGITPVRPLTKNIRETLKEMMQKELQFLPDTLKELEPAQRLNILCKLIPFVLPKVESIDPEYDE